jgi:isoquinoline 1-oxidoreductase subunit beta
MNTVEISSGRWMVTKPSRRGVLEGIGATAFLLAFQLPLSPGRAGEPPGVSGQFNAFLAIGEDDIVTAVIAQTEGGQGNSTGMTQVIAAELGAAWPRVRYRFTTERRPEYINPMLYEGLVLTAGSSSIPGFYGAMRRAAAADALKVERLIGVCDSGLTINPLLAERAVEAGMIFGLSNAMSERITLAGGAPEQTNFALLIFSRFPQKAIDSRNSC